MDRFLVEGGKQLNGTVKISGSKNACLPILVASLLTDEPFILHRVPNLRDVRTTLKILTALGKKTQYENGTVTITGGEILRGAFYNCNNLTSITLPAGITTIAGLAVVFQRKCIG